MKKISVITLLTTLAIPTIINAKTNNILKSVYMFTPLKGHFYSVSEAVKAKSAYSLTETVYYGLTKNITLDLGLGYQEDLDSKQDGFTKLKLGGNYRFINTKTYTSDIFGSYTKSLDKDVAGEYYMLDAGWQIGMAQNNFGAKAKAKLNRIVSKQKIAGDDTSNNIVVATDFAYKINPKFYAQIGVDFTLVDDFILGSIDKTNSLVAKAQINYIKNGFWSLYYKKELNIKNVDGNVGLKYSMEF